MATNCCPPGPSCGDDLCLPTDIGVSRCFTEDGAAACLDDGDLCLFGDECCGGYCLPEPGASDDLACASACVELLGECRADADCCEDSFCDDGSCVPSWTDCTVLGGDCTADGECCSSYCAPTIDLCLPPPP
jgi:hypothetical protein